MIGCCTEHPGVNNNMKQNFLPFFILPNMSNVDYNQLPTDIQRIVVMYLNQEHVIKDLREQIQHLLNRNELLRRNNQRLTLQAIQQLADIQQLEHILANNLDEETRGVQRELDFDNLSDSDYSEAETVYDVDI